MKSFWVFILTVLWFISFPGHLQGPPPSRQNHSVPRSSGSALIHFLPILQHFISVSGLLWSFTAKMVHEWAKDGLWVLGYLAHCKLRCINSKAKWFQTIFYTLHYFKSSSDNHGFGHIVSTFFAYLSPIIYLWASWSLMVIRSQVAMALQSSLTQRTAEWYWYYLDMSGPSLMFPFTRASFYPHLFVLNPPANCRLWSLHLYTANEVCHVLGSLIVMEFSKAHPQSPLSEALHMDGWWNTEDPKITELSNVPRKLRKCPEELSVRVLSHHNFF